MKPKSTVDSPTSRQVTLEEVKKMSDEDLKIEVAKLAGFKNVLRGNFGDVWADDPNFTAGCSRQEVPDYPYDLNAVHEVEQSLSEDQKWQYGLLLANVVRTPENVAFCDPPNKAFPLNELGLFELANLTARQRCEALVLCLSPDSKNTHA